MQTCPRCRWPLTPFSLTVRVQAVDELRQRIRQAVLSSPPSADRPPPMTEADKQEVILTGVASYRCNRCHRCYYAPEVEEVIRAARRFLMPARGEKRFTYEQAKEALAHVLKGGA